MKRALLTALLAVSSCFAANLRVTKIIPEHNIYIFSDKFVVKVDRKIPTLKEGHRLEVNQEYFYAYDSWEKDIHITRKVHVGTDTRRKKTSNKSEWERILANDNSDLEETYTTDTVERYENQTTVERFIFTTIGLSNGSSYDINSFEKFLDHRRETTPLNYFQTFYIENTWFSGGLDSSEESDYSSWRETGDIRTAYLLLDEYRHFETVDGYRMNHHEIYPVFNKYDKNKLVAICSYSYGRKLFKYDYVFGMAYFD